MRAVSQAAPVASLSSETQKQEYIVLRRVCSCQNPVSHNLRPYQHRNFLALSGPFFCLLPRIRLWPPTRNYGSGESLPTLPHEPGGIKVAKQPQLRAVGDICSPSSDGIQGVLAHRRRPALLRDKTRSLQAVPSQLASDTVPKARRVRRRGEKATVVLRCVNCDVA